MDKSPRRYPDERIEILHKDFAKYVLFNAEVEELAFGSRWAEGPVWFGDGRYLLWSDIPNNRILKWDDCNDSVSVFRSPSNYANGNTRDLQGRLVSCEHGSRSVTRTELDGNITTIAAHFDNKKLNSPNDLVIASNGSIWFTDPPFGINNFYEGFKSKQELPDSVYMVDPESHNINLICDDIKGPNGICFSPDQKKLYVVSSSSRPNRLIYSFDVSDDLKSVYNRTVLIDCDKGTPDGLRCDEDGNLWCGWGMGSYDLDGVRVFNPEGVPIGHIHLDQRCANLCFGGRYKNRIFMAAGKSLYSLYVNTKGAQNII